MGSSFACANCGRSFTWKPALAGKRAKCACGQVIVAPESAPAVEEDIYDVAAPPPEAAPARNHPLPPPPPSMSAQVVAYAAPEKDHFSADKLTHAPRDIYIPTALLAIGFIASFAWVLIDLELPAIALSFAAALFGVSTAVKTAALIGLALLFAPAMGISLGTVRPAILKFAAIIIFTDGAILWLGVIMEATGATYGHGRIYLREIAIRLLVAATIITVLTRYLFDMDRDETAMIALPMAVLSRFIGFLMNLLAVMILEAVFAAGAPATAGAPAPAAAQGGSAPAAAGAPAAPAGPTYRLTARDQELSRRIARGLGIRDGWEQADRARPRVPGHRALVDAAYKAGAVKVCFEVGVMGRPSCAFIELPV